MERAGPSKRSVSAVSLALLPTTRCRSLHRRASRSFWRGRFGCAAAPAVAMPEPDLEMTAMLSRAAERVGLEWRKPLCPEPSRLDDWFLGVDYAGSQCLATGASRTCMRSLQVVDGTFTARNRPAHSSSLTTLGGAARGIWGSPRWSGQLRCKCVLILSPPGRANRASSSGPVGTRLVSSGEAYVACGDAAPPNTTALLQVLQAKSTEGHARGWSWSRSSERAPYRIWPPATSDEGYGTVSGSCDVHTRGPGAPPLTVSGWHGDADKVRFLKVPVSQTGLFGDATGNIAQQFPAAQEHTEAIQHVLPRRAAAACTHPPVAAPSLLIAEGGALHPWAVREHHQRLLTHPLPNYGSR